MGPQPLHPSLSWNVQDWWAHVLSIPVQPCCTFRCCRKHRLLAGCKQGGEGVFPSALGCARLGPKGEGDLASLLCQRVTPPPPRVHADHQ